LYYAPKFASPLQHRRLRIASSLFVALDRFRCDSYVWFDERESRHHFHVKVADSYASFQLDAKPAGRGKEPSGLRLELLAGSDCGIRTMWEDDAGKPIERNLTDVAVNLLLTAELRLRERIEASRREAAAAVEREERRRVAAEEAAKAGELERIRQQERVRERALLKDVGRWKRAKAIREFVQAVRERQSDAPPSELACSYSLEWALAHADFIDPVSRSAR
jgi:hypothetical protein